MKTFVSRLFSRTCPSNVILSISILCLCLCINTQTLAKNVNSFESQRQAADKNHYKFAQQLYKKLILSPVIKSARFNSIAALSQAVKQEKNQKNDVKAVALIIRNQYLLTQEYDNPKVITLVKTILDNNALYNANAIIKDLNDLWDENVNAQLNYLIADFYFQRNQWQKTLNLLDGKMNSLVGTHFHNALLIKGISLQKQGKHKDAITVYNKIPADSVVYTEAQFNLALANIRQGWWTDGHRIIEQLASSQPSQALGQSREKVLNHLYITLGYSLLNQAYYRNARKTFQLVGVASQYSNQALLGIALTAAHQEDYIGALNAARFLKAKKEDDLPIDEAHLLMPFFYEKTQQFATASLGYSDASNYYQDKVFRLKRLVNSPLAIDSTSVDLSNGAVITLKQTRIDLLSEYPISIFRQGYNVRQYQKLATELNNTKINNSLSALTKQYNDLTVQIAKSLLQQKIERISSYLNQSRYGLARLYDNNTVKP